MLNDEDIRHYGMPRRSGRYPWGSGGDNDLVSSVSKMKAEGMSEVEIAKALDMSTKELREELALDKMTQREAERLHVTRLKESGMSIEAISRETGLPGTTIRDLLKPTANMKYRVIHAIVTLFKDLVAKYKYIDVGEGVERHLGITDTKLKQAIALLKRDGYTIHYLSEEQLGTGKKTSVMVLAGPNVKWEEVYANRHLIQIPNAILNDDDSNFILGKMNITNVGSNRLNVVYNSNKDGLIELRNTPDLSLGNKRYAQVRIGIDGTHYLKGMAVHSDKLPKGVDIQFYTSKPPKDDKLAALKEQKLEDTNPFSSRVMPARMYKDPKTGKVLQSAVNEVYHEGTWDSWSRNIASQILSKQSPRLAKEQLDIAYKNREAELAEILSITNPVVRAHLLNAYQKALDTAAVDLKAAPMPGQATKVLIPEPSMKPTEIYAPTYPNGTKLKLFRYPHGGIFEIATLTVNNKNPILKEVLESAQDAVGIHPDVASKLSGADFDGDFVLTIPDPTNKFMTSPSLDALKNFEPKVAYAYHPDMLAKYDDAYSRAIGKGLEPAKAIKEAQLASGIRLASPEAKQRLMGDVSNLITDMTIKGASTSEIARAVRHSMVVIDSEKHRLNYRQSYLDNGIAALKKTYQGGATSGASTLISRSSSQQRVPHRKDTFRIDPDTGKKIFIETGQTYTTKDGKTLPRLTKSTQMYETDDARKLSSGTVIEGVYASHANQLKRLADRARLEMVNTKYPPQNRNARMVYKTEVESLERKLNLAMKHQPYERKAQLVGGYLYRKKIENNPQMSKADRRAEKNKALTLARTRLGGTKPKIVITPREWEAIEMGALSASSVARILRNADDRAVKELALPRSNNKGISPAKERRALDLFNRGYNAAEISNALGVSLSVINNLER